MSTAKEQLKAKVQIAFEKRLEAWRSMTAVELIDDCEEVYVTDKMSRLLPAYASEEEAEYLLRFVDPLEVVVDCWIASNGLSAMVGDDHLDYLLWDLRDKRAAEAEYKMEPGFATAD